MPDGNHLSQPPLATKDVRAIGFSITTNLDGNRQIVFQCFVPEDDDPVLANAFLDRVMAMADRQRARYEVGEIEDELAKHRETLANFTEDLARVESKHEHDQAMRRVELEEMARLRPERLDEVKAGVNAEILKIQGRKTAELQAGADEYRKAGRQGSYVPSGMRARNIKLCDEALAKADELRAEAIVRFDKEYDASIASLEAEIQRADNERQQHVANLNMSVQRYTDAIAERELKLAKCRKTLEG